MCLLADEQQNTACNPRICFENCPYGDAMVECTLNLFFAVSRLIPEGKLIFRATDDHGGEFEEQAMENYEPFLDPATNLCAISTGHAPHSVDSETLITQRWCSTEKTCVCTEI